MKKSLTAVGLLAFALTASAATTYIAKTSYTGSSVTSAGVTATIDGVDHTSSIAGLMQYRTKLSLTSSTNTGDDFGAFCVEIQQGTSTSTKQYTIETFSTLSAPRLGMLNNLFSSSYASVANVSQDGFNLAAGATRDDAAAFQLAIWEIVHDTSSVYSLNNGNVTSANLGLAGLANQYLNAAAQYNGPDLYQLQRLTHATSQDLVRAVPMPVPEPANYALMALGLFVVGGMARHRRSS